MEPLSVDTQPPEVPEEMFNKTVRDAISAQKKYFATSSSIYAENSIVNPDIDKVIFW